MARICTNTCSQQSLRNEGFPADWVDSAISYSQLKKCINRLTAELHQVGLDPDTLSKLLKHVEDYNASAHHHDDDEQERPFEYILNDDAAADAAGKSTKVFHPKLIFYVNEMTGEVHGAKMHKETKRKLQLLAVETGLSDMRIVDEEEDAPSLKSVDSCDHAETNKRPTSPPCSRAGYRVVEVPITSDTEFFTRLTREVSGLEKLQQREEKKMSVKIEELGKQVAKLTDPDHRSSRKMLAIWRQIFQMYVEEGIFFGTTELDHKSHDSDKAMQGLAEFSNKIAKAGLVDKLRKKDNLQALNAFMNINREILQGLRFGEMNHSAMLKILKSMSSPIKNNYSCSEYSCNARIRQAHRPRR